MMGKPTPAAGDGPRPPLSAYHQTVRSLSDRLVEAQRPIRVLDAVKWGPEVERAFFAAGARELPPVTPATYRPLPFDPDGKRREFEKLARDVQSDLLPGDPAGAIMVRMC